MKTRLEQPCIIDAANKSDGRTVVRALRIAALDSVPASEPDDTAPTGPDAPTGPAKIKETAWDGYHPLNHASARLAPSLAASCWRMPWAAAMSLGRSANGTDHLGESSRKPSPKR